MKVLYIGDLWLGSTALHRLNAVKEMYPCDEVDSTLRYRNAMDKFVHLAMIKLNWFLDMRGLNRLILQKSGNSNYDIVWIDKGLWVYPGTLAKIKETQPAIKIIGYSPDDMYNPRNQSHWFLKGLKFYDLYVTTKTYNVPELKKMGAKDVFFVDNAFDPELHRKMELTDFEKAEYGDDVVFIGSWEEDRAAHILYLAEHGIKVTVRGKDWKKYKNIHPNILVIDKNEWAGDYAKVLSGARINLCFLKKGNRDLQTQRSIEIPACGGFMMAERTNEHQWLFEEDKEAVFFGTPEELAEKVKYYLANEKLRSGIAEAGYQRCIRSGYSNFHRLKRVFEYLENRAGDQS